MNDNPRAGASPNGLDLGKVSRTFGITAGVMVIGASAIVRGLVSPPMWLGVLVLLTLTGLVAALVGVGCGIASVMRRKAAPMPAVWVWLVVNLVWVFWVGMIVWWGLSSFATPHDAAAIGP